MNLKEEEIRWKNVIEQYKAEIGMSSIEINSLVGKGYVKRELNSVAITEKGIGFMEGTLKSKGISEDFIDNNPATEKIMSLFDSTDYELDIMACHAIYAHKYKSPPTEDSLEVLKKMLKTANIQKSE